MSSMVKVSNAFEVITTDPVKLALWSTKSKLIIIITQFIRKNDMSQKQAAEFFGLSQPRISNMMQGQLSKFSIDMLLEMCIKTGNKVEFDFNPHAEKNYLSIHLIKGIV